MGRTSFTFVVSGSHRPRRPSTASFFAVDQTSAVCPHPLHRRHSLSVQTAALMPFLPHLQHPCSRRRRLRHHHSRCAMSHTCQIRPQLPEGCTTKGNNYTFPSAKHTYQVCSKVLEVFILKLAVKKLHASVYTLVDIFRATRPSDYCSTSFSVSNTPTGKCCGVSDTRTPKTPIVFA